MKKIILFLAVLIMAVCVFAQKTDGNKSSNNMVSVDFITQNLAKGMIEDATPENSVLVYWINFEPNYMFWLKDITSDWEALVKSEHMFIELPPVHKGANLTLLKSGYIAIAQFKSETDKVNFGFYDSVSDSEEYEFKIPKDKSIVCLGLHSLEIPHCDTFEGMSFSIRRIESQGTGIAGMPKTQEAYDKLFLKYQAKALKKLAKKYQGTVWEEVINESLSEVNEQIKAKKK